MQANEYQQEASRTRIDQPDFEISDPQVMIAWNALGLAGEAREVAGLIKKRNFHPKGPGKENPRTKTSDYLCGITIAHARSLRIIAFRIAGFQFFDI